MAENRMELFIETLTGTAFELSCSPLETIVSIKAKIQYSEGIPVSQQHLIWKSQELNDDLCLQDYCINDGATLKLVLGMRGGPINTRQDTKKLKDLAEYVERSSETAGSGGRPFTVLVFHDGDKVHMYTLMERGECTVSPLSGTISETSSIASIKNIEEIDKEIIKENEVTKEKIAQLQEQLRALNINKSKKFSASVAHSNPFSIQEKSINQKCKEDFYLPPIEKRDSLNSPSKQYFTKHAQNKIKTDQKSDNSHFGLMKERPNSTFASSSNTAESDSKHPEKIPSSHQNVSRKTSAALDCIANSISTYLLTSPDKISAENNGHSCSNFLPYIPSALGASSIQKKTLSRQNPQMVAVNVRTPCLDSIIKYDPSRLKKAHKQLPFTSSHALSSRKLIDLDEWIQNRPKTSPEKITYKSIGEKVNKEKLGRDDRSRRKLKHSIKNPLSLNLSQGKSSLMMQMFNDNREVSFSLSPAVVTKSNSNASNKNLKSSGGSLVTSSIKTFQPYMLNDSEVHQNSEVFPNVNSTKAIPKQQNEEINRPQSGKKLPLIKGKKKSKRCSLCSKKTGLATSYICRCGKNFCATHRYAEVHHCSYDYKTEGRRLLQLNNPVVAASKLPKI
ncbi:AN1-type zinc finger protein 4-like isoform X2 [Argiope bruennichi]|uniref:AN1-type zinc finger protein 4-like isoform X2 n=1 Tax=Argiope bruennichi TaxID=94029 RepID=UPI002493F915|nr:AN1-type zinc finger protein 4-like isoform X2 [Argiope bruennichi]